MSEKYKFRNPDGIYFITSTIVDWIDLFIRNMYRDILLDAIKFYQKEKGLVVYAWCIMSNHIHLIVSSSNDEPLWAIIRDFKKYTSRQLINCIIENQESRKKWLLHSFKEAAKPIKRNQVYKVWQDGNHPVELVTNSMMDVRLDYLHMNPVKGGWVSKPEDFLYSSARDYCGDQGLLEVEFLR